MGGAELVALFVERLGIVELQVSDFIRAGIVGERQILPDTRLDQRRPARRGGPAPAARGRPALHPLGQLGRRGGSCGDGAS